MTTHHHKTATLAPSASATPQSEPKAATAPAPEGEAQQCDEKIRLRAYQKWETAGKPQGNGVQFWLDAEQELVLPKKVGSA
jgi:hypothetical protein